MSKRLKDNKTFINLLLKSNRKDARATLKSANKNQLQTLAEIFYNIGVLPVDSNIKTKIRRYKPILYKYIYNPYIRPTLVNKHYKVILKTLMLIKDFLKLILDEKV